MELVPWLVKSTLLLALAFAAVLALRHHSADLRHLIWRAVFAALLLLPVCVYVAPSWTPAADEASLPVRAVITVIAGEPAPAPASAPRGLPLVWLWAAGAGVLLLREAARWARGRWVVSQSVEFGGDARLRLSERVAVPAVYGVLRPVIVLPAAAREWSEDRLRVVLAHERMHILRGDPAWFTAARLAAALWWPHPLVWFALVRLVREAEQACDDGVLAGGTPAEDYATHLVAMVRTISAGEVRYQGGLPMIRVSELERRLRAMLNPQLNRRPAARGTLIAVLLAAAFVLAPLSSLRAPGQAPGVTSIQGTVEDEGGRPVEKAWVVIRQITSTDPVREEIRTDASGRFRIDAIPEGVYSLQFGKEGFASMGYNSIRVSALSPVNVRAQLLPAGETESVPTIATAEVKRPAPAVLQPPPMPVAINVGGNVQAARIESRVEPVYPPELKAAGVEGTVILKIVVDRDGTVKSVEQANKLVDARLAEAAIDAVKQWKFQPTLLNGEPVQVRSETVVRFSLERDKPAPRGPVSFRVSGEVSAPRPIFRVEPEYSEEARAAGLEGTVLLSTVIDEDGTTRDIQVVRSLGMGLDEKAVEALAKWRFRPAMKDGRPVSVQVNVEINFRLLKPPAPLRPPQ